ncbi:MAG: FliI/YscN family ATPase [Pseudomonadota bacterium]
MTPLDTKAPRLFYGEDLLPVKGRLTRVTGTIIRSTLSEVRIGEECRLRDPFSGQEIGAVVVGFDRDEALMTPLDSIHGLTSRTEVISTGALPTIPVGPGLLGRVVSAFGQPLDGRPLPEASSAPIHASPPPAMDRAPIETRLSTGVRAIDGLLTCGIGQRVGIFGPAGTGKSTLLGAILRHAEADATVLGLVGERGREVREFVESVIGPEAMTRTTLVVATSDRPPLERVRAAEAATALAEALRDQGKRVLLVIDSLTRVARALREVGLAAGEPPTRRGFPPSVFAALPPLVERAGPAAKGSITAFYTVLLDGEDDAQDPVADEVRGLLDGHIILSRDLAARGHYPAIDPLASVSRLMPAVAEAAHLAEAQKLRGLIAKARDIELLVQVGEYQKGADPQADLAIERKDAIDAFLRQKLDEATGFEAMRATLAQAVQ